MEQNSHLQGTVLGTLAFWLLQVSQEITRKWHPSPGDTTAHASSGTSPYLGASGFSSEPISSPKGFCSVGYLGPGRSHSGGGQSCCLPVLPACSSSESLPCLFVFGVYLFATEVSAQSRLTVPHSSGGLVAAASSVKVLQCWECFTQSWGRENHVPVRATPPQAPIRSVLGSRYRVQQHRINYFHPPHRAPGSQIRSLNQLGG